MNKALFEICNSNPKNMPSDEVYSYFNDFIFSNDLKLTGKLLYRFKFFELIKHLPGDIVEFGVFKGSGMASFIKFIDIFSPNSNKKVIGFDIFSPSKGQVVLEQDGSFDKEKMNVVYSKTNENELLLKTVNNRLNNVSQHNRHILVEGDIETSLPQYLKENPGFRASLIYIDVDLERPTYAALTHIWDRLLPGGIILFDEFEYHKFSESNGVEKFLKEKGLPFDLISTDWIAPTCYMVKRTF
jgi:hypothetical protein